MGRIERATGRRTSRTARTVRRIASGLALASGVLLASCGILGPEIDDRGVVRFLDVEGGCWVLDAGPERYQPTNLPDEFRVDGLLVRFEAEPRSGLVGFCPGRIVELESIQRIS